MDDDFIFNIEDINIKEETLDMLSAESTPPVEKPVEEQKPEAEVEIPEGGTQETETEEETNISSGEPPSSESDSSHQSTLYALAKYLKDEGVLFLDKELEKVDTIEDLKALIAESHTKAKYKDLSDTQKRYFDALENGIPVKEYENIEKEINTFQNITDESIEENQQLRYELIAIDFINQGIEQSKAIKLAELAMKDETNMQDAKEALQNILKFKQNKFQELITSNKQKTEVELDDIKKAIDSKDKLLEMPVNDVTKKKLFDMMTTKVASDDNGLPLNKLQKYQRDNPVEASILMNYLFLMTNEGKDLGLIKTNTTSLAAKDLEKKLKQMNFDSSGSLIIPDELMSTSDKKQTLKINI